MAIRKEEVENPMVMNIRNWKTGLLRKAVIGRSSNACDVCDEFEATVQYRHTKLCDSCAEEEGIKVL